MHLVDTQLVPLVNETILLTSYFSCIKSRTMIILCIFSFLFLFDLFNTTCCIYVSCTFLDVKVIIFQRYQLHLNYQFRREKDVGNAASDLIYLNILLHNLYSSNLGKPSPYMFECTLYGNKTKNINSIQCTN